MTATAVQQQQTYKRKCRFCRSTVETTNNEDVFACNAHSCQREYKQISRESQKTVDRILGVKTYHRRGAGKHSKSSK